MENKNKLIAKFMGISETMLNDNTEIYRYDKDWNLIVNVIHKIISMSDAINDYASEEEEAGRDELWEEFSDFELSFTHFDFTFEKINRLYDEVVDFIEWYNENDLQKLFKKK